MTADDLYADEALTVWKLRKVCDDYLQARNHMVAIRDARDGSPETTEAWVQAVEIFEGYRAKFIRAVEIVESA